MKIGKAETSDKDLIQMCQKLGILLRFINFKDKLNEVNPKTGAYIVNMASSNHNGTHWVGFFLSPDRKAFYFDSFSAYPAKEILEFMLRWTNSQDAIYFNPYVIQDLHGGYCGQYVVDFLTYMNKNPSIIGFQKFLKQFKLKNILYR